MARVRTEYEVWRDEITEDRPRNAVVWALVELVKITAVYGALLGSVLLLSAIF